jgi:hypothetical protein
MLMFLCGIWTGTVIGFASHIALMEMKRARRMHELLNLTNPPEIINIWAENNRRLNVEEKRRQIKIVTRNDL